MEAVAGFTSVLTLVVTVLFFYLGRDTKELTVETVSSAILVDLSDSNLSSLKLTYKDVSVSRLSVATIELRNSGTLPIVASDFERSFVIMFKNPADVLAVTVADKTPPDLDPSILSNLNGISVSPMLLNPGDRFRLTVQLRGDFNEPTVNARISGVSTISRRLFSGADSTWRVFVFIVFSIVSTFIYFYSSGFILPGIFRRSSLRMSSLVIMPIQQALVVVVVLGIASVLSLLSTAKTLELSNTQAFSVMAALGVLGTIACGISIRRSYRLRAMYEIQRKLDESPVSSRSSQPVS